MSFIFMSIYIVFIHTSFLHIFTQKYIDINIKNILGMIYFSYYIFVLTKTLFCDFQL